MIPKLLFQIALLIIVARSVFVVFNLLNRGRKEWIDILFHISVAIVALSFLL